VQVGFNFGNYLYISLMVVLGNFTNRNNKNFLNKNKNFELMLKFVF